MKPELLKELTDWLRQVSDQPPSRVNPGIRYAAENLHARILALSPGNTARAKRKDHMETKRKPATPLPWNEAAIIEPVPCPEWTGLLAEEKHGDVVLYCHPSNAAYIAHAANAYPKLVEALRAIANGRTKDYLTAHGCDVRGSFEDRLLAVAREALATCEET